MKVKIKREIGKIKQKERKRQEKEHKRKEKKRKTNRRKKSITNLLLTLYLTQTDPLILPRIPVPHASLTPTTNLWHSSYTSKLQISNSYHNLTLTIEDYLLWQDLEKKKIKTEIQVYRYLPSFGVAVVVADGIINPVSRTSSKRVIKAGNLEAKNMDVITIFNSK